MATLLELCQQNQLIPIDPELDFGALDRRCLYLLPSALERFNIVLQTEGGIWNIQEKPDQQMDALFNIFCGGKPLAIGHKFKYLRSRKHVHEGIWELKTADVRLIGWFPQKDHFIISEPILAQNVKEAGLYHGLSMEAYRKCKLLDLNPPKFISGDNPDDVVSNWSQP